MCGIFGRGVELKFEVFRFFWFQEVFQVLGGGGSVGVIGFCSFCVLRDFGVWGMNGCKFFFGSFLILVQFLF